MKDYLMRIVVYGFLAFPVCTAEDTAKVVGQSEPVVATVDDDVILPCTLRTIVRTINAVEEAVVWQRPDLKPKEVHFYRSREDYNDDQNNNYRGRTSLFKEEMKNGNISLKLTRVKLSDVGIYICFIPTLKSHNKRASVQLSVGAASKPQITVFGIDLMGVILKCEAGGLMHRPEMTWLDSDGNILPDGTTETKTDSEGHYTVRGHVTIQKTDNNTFTCRVQQQQINHKMETEIHVPDEMFPERCSCQSYWSQSCWWGWLIVGLVGGAGVLYFGWCLYGFTWNKFTKSKRKRNRETTDVEDSPMNGVEDGNKEVVQTTGS